MTAHAPIRTFFLNFFLQIENGAHVYIAWCKNETERLSWENESLCKPGPRTATFEFSQIKLLQVFVSRYWLTFNSLAWHRHKHKYKHTCSSHVILTKIFMNERGGGMGVEGESPWNIYYCPFLARDRWLGMMIESDTVLASLSLLCF